MMFALKQERLLLIPILLGIAAWFAEHALLEHGQVASLVAAVILIAAIVIGSMRVAHHAEILAHKVGDPYGTMILTLSAVAVEVIILAIMMNKGGSPTLVRDTIYSAVMLDINGILGLAALIIWFGLRPSINAILKRPEPAAIAAVAEDANVSAVDPQLQLAGGEIGLNLIGDLTNASQRSPLRKLEQLIDFNEAQAAAILKQWIHEGERA